MSEHQTGPRCRRIPHQKTHTRFQAAILQLLHTHNALGLGLHRQPIYNHYTWRTNSIEEACQDPNFPCAMINGVSRLKRDHKQGCYAQVQGQLALSGLP